MVLTNMESENLYKALVEAKFREFKRDIRTHRIVSLNIYHLPEEHIKELFALIEAEGCVIDIDQPITHATGWYVYIRRMTETEAAEFRKKLKDNIQEASSGQ